MLSITFLSLSFPLFIHCAPFDAPLNPEPMAGHTLERDSGTVFLQSSTLPLPTSTLAATTPTMADGQPTVVPAASEAVFVLPPQAFGAGQETGPLVMAYYPDWAPDSFPPEKIDFQRFDWIDFAFAIPDVNFNLTWDSPKSVNLLSRLVACAHSKGKKVKLSIGGWTGSRRVHRILLILLKSNHRVDQVFLVSRCYYPEPTSFHQQYLHCLS